MAIDLLGPAALNAVTVRPSRSITRGSVDSWFRDCSSPLVEDGTSIGADFLNDVLAQFRQTIRNSEIKNEGLDDAAFDRMLWHAILSRSVRYAPDTGSANNLIASFTPPIASFYDGLLIQVRVAANNTGATTIVCNDNAGASHGAVPVRNRDGSALAADALVAGAIVMLVYNAGVFQIVGPQAGDGVGGGGGGGECCAGVTGQLVFAFGDTALAGTLKANGAVVSRASYPNLWTYAQASNRIVSESDWNNAGLRCWTSFSSGDGSTTFRIPDLRGEFLRMFDDGKGIDVARVLGRQQADEIRSHSHGLTGAIGGAGANIVAYNTAFNPIQIGGSGAEFVASYNATIAHSLAISAAGGTETRPRNAAVMPCIVY